MAQRSRTGIALAYLRALQLSQSARAADLPPQDRAKLDGEGR